MRNIGIDGERLWRSLMEMGEIGATPDGGCRRLTLSAEDKEARDLFVRWAREAGLAVAVDRMGNIFCRRAGTRDDLPPVMMGSHLDTVPTGGKFDGPYGVLAGLEVMRALDDAGVETQAPIELVMWTNEEGSRFSPYTLGSLAYAGAIELDFALSRTDPDGVTVAQALTEIGYAGQQGMRDGRPVAAYFEAHIEQGPYLEASGDEVGIVTGSFISRYFVATVRGVPAHVGPTAMPIRKDALVGAAHVILEANRIGNAHGVDGRGNAPHLEIFPNVRGVIPSEVKVSCDVRHSDLATVEAMEAELRAAVAGIAAETGLEIDLDGYFQFGPIAFDPGMTARVRDTAAALGLRHRDILTVAGHDAVSMNAVCPSAMVFIPSRGGISHNPGEWSSPEHCAAGARVLLGVVLETAGTLTGAG